MTCATRQEPPVILRIFSFDFSMGYDKTIEKETYEKNVITYKRD